jgi:hypothetical protein
MPLTPEQIDALQAEVIEIERTTGYGRVTIAIEGRPKFLETTKSTYLCQESLPDRRQHSPRKPLPG